MPSLFQPTIVRYRLANGSCRTPDGQYVKKDTPGAVRTKVKSPTWWGKWADRGGVEHKERLSEKKEVARRMLAKLSGDAQLAGVGLADRFEGHRLRPLAEHVQDFGRYLSAKGDSDVHATRTVARCLKIVQALGAEQLEDLQPSAVLEVLATWRQDKDLPELPTGVEMFTKADLITAAGLSPHTFARFLRRLNLQGEGNGKARRYSRAIVETLRDHFARGSGIVTTNHYVTAIKGFTRWMAREHRSPIDLLAFLSRQNPATDLRHVRRSLPAAEFAALLKATAAGKPTRSLGGRDRAALYLLAARSGLRASELASLTPASFDFADSSATVEAGYSKHRRKDVQPLPEDVAAELQRFCAGKPKRSPLWPGSWPDLGADMLRGDLAAARSAWIAEARGDADEAARREQSSVLAYADEGGNVYDFHALRHQFITDMVSSGIHPKDAQTLARHSSIVLTMDHYAHVRKADLRSALEKLPPLTEKEGEGKRQADRA